MNIDKIKFVGKFWGKAGKQRYYFRNINNLLGLRLTLKANGLINKAYLNGSLISIKEAKSLDCRNKEFYYDVNLGRFHYNDDINPAAIDLIIKALC